MERFPPCTWTDNPFLFSYCYRTELPTPRGIAKTKAQGVSTVESRRQEVASARYTRTCHLPLVRVDETSKVLEPEPDVLCLSCGRTARARHTTMAMGQHRLRALPDCLYSHRLPSNNAHKLTTAIHILPYEFLATAILSYLLSFLLCVCCWACCVPLVRVSTCLYRVPNVAAGVYRSSCCDTLQTTGSRYKRYHLIGMSRSPMPHASQRR